LLGLVSAAAHAHSFDPSLLDLREREGGIYDVIWKTAVAHDEGRPSRPLVPVFGAACRRIRALSAPSAEAEGLVVFRIDCGKQGLRGQTIGVAGLADNPTDVLLRIELADGTLMT